MNNVLTMPKDSYKVDIGRGSVVGRLSSEWSSRPDDERYLNLKDLYADVKLRSDASHASALETRHVEVRARRDDAHLMELVLDDKETVQPNHWSFGQLCSLVGAPAGYLRRLPAPISAIPLQYDLINNRSELAKFFITERDGRSELRAATSPTYGRIHDHEVVEAVMRIAGDGAGETHWKIPGTLDWSTMTYNPDVEPAKHNTTLYASDRDVFLFLVDDKNPIEVGTLADGNPDLMFRGFYVWNSEVGSKSMGVATMYLRAVCMNRNLWGVEHFNEVRLRHTKYAPERFLKEAAPALEEFSNASTAGVLGAVNQAKLLTVARDDDERAEFLVKQGFSKRDSTSIIDRVVQGEGHPPENVWDFVQGIAAFARDIPHQDARITVERTAGKLMKAVA